MKAKGDLFLNRQAARSDLCALQSSLWIKIIKFWKGARLEIRRVRQLLQLPIKEIMVNRTKTVAEETERE